MLTGALLLDPEKNIAAKDYIKKYVLRILLAIVIFGIPFSILKMIMETKKISISFIPLSVKAIIENDSLSHMWYLYTLIGLYIVLPILRSFVKYASDKEVLLVLISFFIIDFVFPLINGLVNCKIAFDLPLKYPVFYVLMGWELKRNSKSISDKINEKRCIVFVFGIIGVIWILNFTLPSMDYLVGYNSPLIVILSMAIFFFFKIRFCNAGIKKEVSIWKVDRLCFGVYLIHPVFIQFTYRFLKVTPIYRNFFPLFTIACFGAFTVLSFIASWMISRIPLLR